MSISPESLQEKIEFFNYIWTPLEAKVRRAEAWRGVLRGESGLGILVEGKSPSEWLNFLGTSSTLLANRKRVKGFLQNIERRYLPTLMPDYQRLLPAKQAIDQYAAAEPTQHSTKRVKVTSLKADNLSRLLGSLMEPEYTEPMLAAYRYRLSKQGGGKINISPNGKNLSSVPEQQIKILPGELANIGISNPLRAVEEALFGTNPDLESLLYYINVDNRGKPYSSVSGAAKRVLAEIAALQYRVTKGPVSLAERDLWIRIEEFSREHPNLNITYLSNHLSEKSNEDPRTRSRRTDIVEDKKPILSLQEQQVVALRILDFRALLEEFGIRIDQSGVVEDLVKDISALSRLSPAQLHNSLQSGLEEFRAFAKYAEGFSMSSYETQSDGIKWLIQMAGLIGGVANKHRSAHIWEQIMEVKEADWVKLLNKVRGIKEEYSSPVSSNGSNSMLAAQIMAVAHPQLQFESSSQSLVKAEQDGDLIKGQIRSILDKVPSLDLHLGRGTTLYAPEFIHSLFGVTSEQLLAWERRSDPIVESIDAGKRRRRYSLHDLVLAAYIKEFNALDKGVDLHGLRADIRRVIEQRKKKAR